MRDASVKVDIWDRDHFDDECLGEGEQTVVVSKPLAATLSLFRPMLVV